MTQVFVYRNQGNHRELSFRTHRHTRERELTEHLDYPEEIARAIRSSKMQVLQIQTILGEMAPPQYRTIWSGGNPSLDSIYSYLSKPSDKELAGVICMQTQLLPDGTLSPEVEVMEFDCWSELTVESTRCIVGSQLIAGHLTVLGETWRMQDYLNNSYLLGDFLEQFIPTGYQRGPIQSSMDWIHRQTGEIFESPEVIIHPEAIHLEHSRLLS